MKQAFRAISIIISSSVFLTALAIWSVRQDKFPESVGFSRALHPSPMAGMSAASLRSPAEDKLAEELRPGATPAVDTRTPDREAPQTSIDILRKKVLDTYPDIAEYRQLRRTVLQTSDQRKIFRDMLKDSEQIAAARSDLLTDDPMFSEERQFQRMYRVSYLDAALEWQENPKREEVVRTMEDIIFASNITADTSRELQHALAGDKVELYLSLLQYAPERAAQMAAKAKGTDLEKLLAYAKARFDAVVTAEANEE